MPRRRQSLQPTTVYRYQWIIDHYIEPALGSMPLRSVRAEHLDRGDPVCYAVIDRKSRNDASAVGT